MVMHADEAIMCQALAGEFAVWYKQAKQVYICPAMHVVHHWGVRVQLPCPRHRAPWGWEEGRQLVLLWSLLPCCATACWDALVYQTKVYIRKISLLDMHLR
jgi:hypothetical protein